MKPLVYKKRGMILKGDFPLVQAILELQELTDRYYWSKVRKEFRRELDDRVKQQWESLNK